MWINQPSTLQPDHHHHGKLVLANPQKDEKVTDVYPVKGNTISMRVFVMSLSDGWPEHLR